MLRARFRPPWKEVAIGLPLSLASIAFALLCGEIVLRVFFPDTYYHAATAINVADATKIWAPPAGVTSYYRHPDTRESVPIVRNNLGIRSDRNLSWPDLASTTNVAFFGDSFTANMRMAARYSFPEVLKHLLNSQGRRFEVLNFGVEGYGPDQSYAWYRELDVRIRERLDHVVFVYYVNDLRDLAAHGLASLDHEGKVVLTPKFPRIPEFAKRITQLHMTYFIVDLYNRISGVRGYFEGPAKAGNRKRKSYKFKDNPYLESTKKLFNALLLQWQGEVEALGGKFHVAVVPLEKYRFMPDLLDKRLHTIDLYRYFSKVLPDYRFSQITFKKDSHWNEAGNLLAAIALQAELAPVLGLPALTGAELVPMLRPYYGAAVEGWRPSRIGRFDFDGGTLVKQ